MLNLFRPNKLAAVMAEYPRQFWVLVAAAFIDRLGGTMLFPFFAIYMSVTFDVGLTAVAYIFLIAGLAGFVGSFFGGPITDRFGRKGSILVGLVASGLASIGIGTAPTITWMIVFTTIGSFFGSIGDPARRAMIGDLLGEDQRAEGFGIMRVVMNMAWVVGPLLGGLMATRSYLLLFLADAVTSGIMGLIVLRVIKESMPDTDAANSEERLEMTLGGTLRSYLPALRDRTFMVFFVLVMVAQFVYHQMYVALPYYIVDVRGMSESAWGIILACNATLVVLTQFPITRKVKSIPPLMVLAGGTFFYALGFSMYGVFSGLFLFSLAMIFITIGEMLFLPTADAFATNLAPPSMRGRYMAVFGFAQAIPGMVGTLPAGYVMDNHDPELFWLFCGALALLTTGAYWLRRGFGVTPIIDDSEGTLAAPAKPVAAGD